MKTEAMAYDLATSRWSSPFPTKLDSERTLVLAFGAPELPERSTALRELAGAFPRSVVVGCSTAGEIHGPVVRDASLSVTVTKFDYASLALAHVEVRGAEGSFAAGEILAKRLAASGPSLRAVFVLSEGLGVNGSELVRGLNASLDPSVVVTGGLSADGSAFKRTWVARGATVSSNVVVAVGFYGERLIVDHGTRGGWDRFGPERVVTRSDGNVLYELDGKPALALYEEYLGARAKDLPASGLLFPLAMRASQKDEKYLVRTLLSVDRAKQSMSFAGDVPRGHFAQLMRADFEKLIDGARGAGLAARTERPSQGDTLAIAVSCVGRRLVLGDRTDEEVEAVLETLPDKGVALTGFYSYGELAPHTTGPCDLHNQTMTLTVLRESSEGASARTSNDGPRASAPAFGKLIRPSAPPAKVGPRPTPNAEGAPSSELAVVSLAYDIREKRWSAPFPPLDSPRTLVLAFGAPEAADDPTPLADLARAFPRSIVVGCSGAREVHDTQVRDGSIAVTVTRFAETDLSFASADVTGADTSRTTAETLAKKLERARPGLRGVLVLSEGLGVNGSELARGFREALPADVVVTGGLAGDGARFEKTWVSIGGKLRPHAVAAVGFYGDAVTISHGSKGGWDRFGPERVVTRSRGNVVYELDGRPALRLYEEYLGERAKALPASGLLFPLSVRSSQTDERRLVRTLLSVDREAQSLTFAGDVHQGSFAQLMKADFEKLVDGAGEASGMLSGVPDGTPSLVVAISCVGRRLVLGDRTEEEIEAVKGALPRGGDKAHVTGFYSYGELSPFVDPGTGATGPCELHNQTMTLTVFSEGRRVGRTKVDTAPRSAPSPSAPKAPPPPPSIPRVEPGVVSPIAASPSTFTTARWAYSVADRRFSLSTFPKVDSPRTLVLAFGDASVIDDPSPFERLAKELPTSIIVGCSSAGEIHGTLVRDGSLSITATRFAKTELALASFEVKSAEDSRPVGRALAKRLLAEKPGLRAVLVLSDGLAVNGSELVRGINETLDPSVVVTGGLAGDGSRFERTWVAVGGRVARNVIAAVGFYGDHVVVGHGSKGGWDTFGPERVVTRSEGNVLYELDGKPALALYKEYLGEKAKDLPASGLLFPLAMRASSRDEKVLVRTLLAVDHERGSMTFAGDLPRGHLVQLMRADFDKLVGGASLAATAVRGIGNEDKSLTIAISCVGRRLVLGDRTEEEVEAVKEALPNHGEKSEVTGFYSYGEISPYATGHCDLHNQTMTLTVISESSTPLERLEPIEDPTRARMPPGPRVSEAPLPVAPPRREAPSVAVDATIAPPVSTSQVRVPVDTSAIPVVVRATNRVASASASTVVTETLNDTTVLRMSGRISESFKGDAVGSALSGVVVIDLGDVERVTSYGVREWLAMLGCAKNARSITFARCSEAIVNQLGMIRKFAGAGHVASFFAPYQCTRCGEPFERLFDVERDRDAILAAAPPEASCPACGAKGRFDDEPETYFAFARPHVGTPVEPSVRAVLSHLAETRPETRNDPVDKTVEGDTTRVRLQTKLTPDLRWKRIFDGVEGNLVLDLGAAGVPDASAVRALEAGLSAIAPDLSRVTLERCPEAMLDKLEALRALPGFQLASAMMDGFCPSCDVPRAAYVSTSEHAEVIASGRAPAVPCKRCGAPLTIAGISRLAEATARPAVRSEPQPVAIPAPDRTAADSGNRRWRSPMVVVGAASAAFALSLVAYLGTRPPPAPGHVEPVATTTPSPSAKPSVGSTEPPPWTERDLVIGAEEVTVVGRADAGLALDAALKQARSAAILRVVQELGRELSGSPVYEFVAARVHGEAPRSDAAVVDRFVAQCGTFASPERVETWFGPAGPGFVKFRLERAAYQKAVALYRETAQVQGMVVGRVFPTLERAFHSEGEIVVLSVQKGRLAEGAGVRPGDVVLAVESRHVASPEAFAKTMSEAYTQTPPRGAPAVDVEAAGARRTVRLYKAPPTP